MKKFSIVLMVALFATASVQMFGMKKNPNLTEFQMSMVQGAISTADKMINKYNDLAKTATNKKDAERYIRYVMNYEYKKTNYNKILSSNRKYSDQEIMNILMEEIQ